MNPKDELNCLLNEAITIGCRLIEKHGGHFPFVMTLTRDGERSDVVADDRETQDAEKLFETVRCRVMEGIRTADYRAVALAKNVTFRYRQTGKPTDAIQITLGHRHTAGSTCYLPYQLVEGRVIPGELFATEPALDFFKIEQ